MRLLAPRTFFERTALRYLSYTLWTSSVRFHRLIKLLGSIFLAHFVSICFSMRFFLCLVLDMKKSTLLIRIVTVTKQVIEPGPRQQTRTIVAWGIHFVTERNLLITTSQTPNESCKGHTDRNMFHGALLSSINCKSRKDSGNGSSRSRRETRRRRREEEDEEEELTWQRRVEIKVTDSVEGKRGRNTITSK